MPEYVPQALPSSYIVIKTPKPTVEGSNPPGLAFPFRWTREDFSYVSLARITKLIGFHAFSSTLLHTIDLLPEGAKVLLGVARAHV